MNHNHVFQSMPFPHESLPKTVADVPRTQMESLDLLEPVDEFQISFTLAIGLLREAWQAELFSKHIFTSIVSADGHVGRKG